MDTLLYSLLTLAFFLPWTLAWIVRADLRPKMLRASVVGSLAGILAELWYFRDYWRPPTLLGEAMLSPEDFLIGFALAGSGVSIYDVLFQTRDTPKTHPQQRVFSILCLAGCASLLIFSTWLGANSVITSEIAFAGAAAIMVMLRRDLLRVALLSGILLGLYGFLVYLVLFSWMAPHYWQTYWLLKDHPVLGATVLGVPVLEIFWYTVWGALAGVIPNFVRGTAKTPYRGTAHPRCA